MELLTALHLHPGENSLRQRPRVPELQLLRTSPPAGGVQEKSEHVPSAEEQYSHGRQNMPQVHFRVQKTEKNGPSVSQVLVGLSELADFYIVMLIFLGSRLNY